MTSVGILIALNFCFFTHLENIMALDQEFISDLISLAPEGKSIYFYDSLLRYGNRFFKNEDF